MPTSTQTSTHTLTELLSHLIRMPTVSTDHATCRAALDWIEDQLSNLPLKFTRIEHNGFPSLVAITTGVNNPKQPKLWLSGHIDVVPGEAHSFEPSLREGRLYGRGAYDMKYGIAVFIALLQELGQELAACDIGLMITSDEELGGFNGSGHLAELGYGGPTMLLPECGLPWNMEAGAKSVNWWKFTSRGQAAHAAYNWRGMSAVTELMACLSELNQKFAAEPCGDPEHLHSTMNVGVISGGKAPNQVAEHAEATIDIRAMPEIPEATIAGWVNEVTANYPGIEVEQVAHGEGFITHDDNAAKLFREITEAVTGNQLTRKLAPASSDARFFAPHGTQVICVPPLGGDQHSSHEWIDLKSLDQYARITREFVDRWAKKEQR